MRTATLNRTTTETEISISIDLDGTGEADIDTGIGFLDHMLTSLTRHAQFDLQIKAVGDLHVDLHHTTEDIAICFGQAVSRALGSKQGITRFGQSSLPMDDAWVDAALDICGRAYLNFAITFGRERIGEMDTELFEEFFRAFSSHAGLTLHLSKRAGTNAHHIAEACFKATARALRQAVQIDPQMQNAIPSTKGVL